MILQTLQTIDYSRELIAMLLKAKAGTFVVHIIGPLFYFYVFKDSIPTYILYSWILTQFVVFIFRMLASRRLGKVLYTEDEQTVHRYLKTYLIFIFINALLWGLSSIPAVFYGSETEVFILVAGIFAVVSGSIMTLTPVYHAVFIFITTILSTFVLSLAFIGDTSLYYAAASLFVTYLIIGIPAGFRIYQALSDSFNQQEEIKALNLLLEHRVEEAIAETEKREKLLQEQSRMVQMGEMLSMIAHQWRQPLSAINSAIGAMQLKYRLEVEPDGQQNELLDFMDKKHENIAEYVQLLSTTINDFRDFFKPEKKRESTALTIPIERALQIVDASMRSNKITIITDFQTDDSLMLYQNELMQVILNILKNAEDNLVEKKIENAQITISTKKEDDNSYMVSLVDNGGGIREEVLPNIFDPYFSTKDEKNGTGLGLYMSKVMIEEHHGGILKATNVGDGVCFEITLKEGLDAVKDDQHENGPG